MLQQSAGLFTWTFFIIICICICHLQQACELNLVVYKGRTLLFRGRPSATPRSWTEYLVILPFFLIFSSFINQGSGLNLIPLVVGASHLRVRLDAASVSRAVLLDTFH